jgi:hypothetical protein
MNVRTENQAISRSGNRADIVVALSTPVANLSKRSLHLSAARSAMANGGWLVTKPLAPEELLAHSLKEHANYGKTAIYVVDEKTRSRR